MKINYSFIIFLFVFKSFLIKAQDSSSFFINKIAINASSQFSAFTSSSGVKEQLFGSYIGYKFSENISFGFNAGFHQELIKVENYYNESYYVGLGFKYFMKKTNYKINPELYLNINSAVEHSSADKNFLFYDFGLNALLTSTPYFFVGTGIRQNFYNYERKSLIALYYSFGLRF